MDTNRRARVAQLIQEELTVLLSRSLKDPRIGPVTLTGVEISTDGKSAKVKLTHRCTTVTQLYALTETPSETIDKKTVQASEAALEKSIEGLQSAAPWLRHQLLKLSGLKHVPELQFIRDKGIENAIRVHELLGSIAHAESQRRAPHS